MRGHCIPGEKHFEIHTLEVWRVGPPPAVKQTEKSILDKVRDQRSNIDYRTFWLRYSSQDPQAQALLELAGKKMHSTAYRDPAPLLSDGEDD